MQPKALQPEAVSSMECNESPLLGIYPQGSTNEDVALLSDVIKDPSPRQKSMSKKNLL